jgi:YHS domain-containing protein
VTPTRIAIIAILVYILYRLLVGPRKKADDSVPHGYRGNRGGPIDDVLVKDPVCNTYIPQRQAVALVHEQQTYYFCSDTCRKTFLAEKEKG